MVVDPYLLRPALIARTADTGPTDAELLGRYAACRDEAAFAEVVRRNGPVVLRACRSVLGTDTGVDDAFQATFLLLARRAGRLTRPGSLAGWLHAAAVRIARTARRAEARRQRWERSMPPRPQPQPDEMIWREVREVLDAELAALPERYRAPLVLCYLQELPPREAARRVGCSVGALRGRLERGRERLRQRLARYGLPLAAPVLVLGRPPTVSAALAEATLAIARAWAAGGAVPRAVAGLLPLRAGARVWLLASVAVLTSVVLALAGGISRPTDSPRPDREARRATLRTPSVRPPEATGQKTRPKTPERKDAFGDPLPAGALTRLGTVRFRHSQNVSDIAFAPDGKSLAAVDTDRVCLWEAATGKELRRLEGSTSGHGLAFSPDGKSLATAIDGAILFWDPATGKQLRRFPVPGSPVQSLTFSPDGKTLAWVAQDNNVRLCAAATGKVLHKWPGPPNVVSSSVAFSPDSRTLALACQKENDVPLYDTATGKEVRRFINPQKTVYSETVYGVAFSPDGKTLVSSARDNALRFWDAATGKELRQVKQKGVSWKLAFSPDGKILATGGGNVRLWDTATGKPLRFCERDDDGNVKCLAFSPDGKTLAASRANSHALSLWDVASGKKRLAFAGHLGLVAGVAVAPDGKLLASAAWEKNHTGRNGVHLWDPVTGKEVGTVGNDLGFVGGLTFSPDGRLLAAGNEDGTIRIWDAATRREVRRLTGHKSMVEWVGFTADGKVLASLGYHDRTLRLWDVAAGKKLRQFLGNQPIPEGGIALAPDGKTIVQGGEAKPSLVLWDAATGKAVDRYGNCGWPVTAVALSPDGRMLASAARGHGVQLWDVASGKELRQLPDPNFWVSSLIFSPDGRTLACGGRDNIVRLWEVATGTERCRFVGHRGAIRSGAFSPDGRKFFSGSEDSTVLIWDVTGQVACGRLQIQQLSPRELEELRADLAAADGARAYRALWTLVAVPRQAVALFRDQLRPVRAADPERVARLLADLDSNVFAVRGKASKELQKMGETALPALRKALAAQPPLERRRRVEHLLKVLRGSPAERFYTVRAVEVLERIGSLEARTLVETLAGGVPEARLTREAKATLRRLAHRPAATP